MSTTPTTIADSWPDITSGLGVAKPCEHGQPAYLTCPDCDAADEARQLAERAAEVVDNANARCDRLFPARYRAATPSHPDVARWVDDYRAKGADAPSLLLVGPTGTGKTWQGYGALRQAVTHPRPARGVGYRATDWRAATYADLLASVRPSGSTDPEATLEGYRTAPLLLVDDLGVAKNSEWVEDVTYRLINGRYQEMRPSIFTTNLSIDQLREALGDRIASRLAEICRRVILSGVDRRRAP